MGNIWEQGDAGRTIGSERGKGLRTVRGLRGVERRWGHRVLIERGWEGNECWRELEEMDRRVSYWVMVEVGMGFKENIEVGW